MNFNDLTEGALAGHYRVLRKAKAEGKSKAEAHEIAKKRGAHPNTVEDIYRDEVNEARWEFKPNKTYMVGDRLTWDDKYEFYLSQEDADILNKFMQQADSDETRTTIWRMFWNSEETGDTAEGPVKAIAYAKKALGISEGHAPDHNMKARMRLQKIMQEAIKDSKKNESSIKKIIKKNQQATKTETGERFAIINDNDDIEVYNSKTKRLIRKVRMSNRQSAIQRLKKATYKSSLDTFKGYQMWYSNQEPGLRFSEIDKELEEMTSAGAIASVAQPIGKMQRRKKTDEDKKKSPAGGPACWDGKKIHPTKPTKMKGGKEVPNCVPESTVNEISDEERAARRADDERRHKNNPAMLKALRSIEATFGPERKKINDQVMAMMRTVSMLESPRWKDRAFSNVEPYGIDNVQQLIQEIKLMIADEKKALAANEEGLIYGIDTNIRQMTKALEKLSQLGESQGWCGICGNDVCTCTDDRVMEQQLGVSKVNLENILISMQHDISKGKLIPEHMDQLIQQHNELMEIYEALDSGELSEQRIDEVLPLAALAVHGARMAAGAALRTAAGQALKRGAINIARSAARRAGQGIKNLFRRGKAGRRARSRAAGALGGDDDQIKNFGDLNLGRRNSSNLSTRAAAAGLNRGDIDALGGN